MFVSITDRFSALKRMSSMESLEDDEISQNEGRCKCALCQGIPSCETQTRLTTDSWDYDTEIKKLLKNPLYQSTFDFIPVTTKYQ